MREIKFRCWSFHNKEMYGHNSPYPTPYHFQIYNNGNIGYLPTFGNDSGDLISFYSDVEPEDEKMKIAIMQFTGLQDKNGKDIYEGDIGRIATQSGRIENFVVEWGIHRREMKSGWTVDIPSFCFRLEGFPSFPIVDNYLNGHDLEIIEIIGNIYESPELLNQSK